MWGCFCFVETAALLCVQAALRLLATVVYAYEWVCVCGVCVCVCVCVFHDFECRDAMYNSIFGCALNV